MTNEAIEAGSIVVLISGGPKMAVSYVCSDRINVACVWITTKGKPQSATYRKILLRVASDEPLKIAHEV